jgi:hypothetical protein
MKASELYLERGNGDGVGMRLLMPAFEKMPTLRSLPSAWPQRVKTLYQRCRDAAVYQTVLERLKLVAGNVTRQAGTVRTLSALMLALARETLIDANASREMVSFLRVITYVNIPTAYLKDPNKEPASVWSYVEEALRRDVLSHRGLDLGLNPDHILRYFDLWSKIGVVNPMYCDWAFVRFKRAGSRKTDSLGIVILNYVGQAVDEDGHIIPPTHKNPDARFLHCVQDIVSAYFL